MGKLYLNESRRDKTYRMTSLQAPSKIIHAVLIASVLFSNSNEVEAFSRRVALHGTSFQNTCATTPRRNEKVERRRLSHLTLSFQPFGSWIGRRKTKETKSNEKFDAKSEQNAETQLKQQMRPISAPSLVNVEALLYASGIAGNVSESDMCSIIDNIALANSKKFFSVSEKANGINTDTLLAMVLPYLEQIIEWDTLGRNLFAENQTLAASVRDNLLRDATKQMEDFVNETLTAFTLDSIQNLLARVETPLASKEIENAIDAAPRARKLTRVVQSDVISIPYIADLVSVLNDFLFASGYLPLLDPLGIRTPITSFFKGYAFTEVYPADSIYSVKAAEMAQLAGEIYEDTFMASLYELGHTVVANGTSADVAWLISDSIDTSGGKPTLVRTITVRGYHAVDNRVDRVRLLNRVCSATPVAIGENGVLVHSGLLDVAKELYQHIIPYISGLSKDHKLTLNGHSIGGCISVLLLLLLTTDFGVGFVRNTVKQVFTFGAPPVAMIAKHGSASATSKCAVLESFGLPLDLVKGYVQPWDPIVRLFSNIDPLYPLVDDIGEDGATLWANGPPRTLRQILKVVLENWKDWPRTREICRSALSQDYTHVGMQHLLLPEPTRYLTDRVAAVNIATPPIKSIIQLHNSQDLLPLLNVMFPLDVFGISYVSVAIRSFVHHFHPAYVFPFLDFRASADGDGKKEGKNQSTLTSMPFDEENGSGGFGYHLFGANNIFNFNWAESAADWVLGGIGYKKMEQ